MEGSLEVANNIYNNYVQDCVAPNEPVSAHSFKKTLNAVHGITTAEVVYQNEILYMYKNLKYVGNETLPDTDVLVHPVGCFKIKEQDGTVIIGQKSGIRVHGVELIKEIIMDSDHEVLITIGDNSIRPTSLGLPNNIKETNLSFHDYVQVLAECRVCIGKDVPKGTPGAQLWEIQGENSYRKHSKTCYALMNILARGNICRRCHSISVSTPACSLVSEAPALQEPEPCNPPPGEEQQHPPGEEQEEEHEIQEEHGPNIDDMMESLFPNANDMLADFICSQSMYCIAESKGRDPRTRRWSKKMIGFALSLWITSPAAYRLLSKYMYMPCERTLQHYKNTIDKKPGVNMEMIKWMWKECERTQTPKQGGLIFDEMHIQPGIQMERHGDGLKMFGYVDYGQYNNGLNEATHVGQGIQLGTTILQFVFLAYNAFRFPFSYMVSGGLTTGQVITLFWDIVNKLQTSGFTIDFVCMDGASVNRSFINLICDCLGSQATNIVSLDPKYISCIMDFSHVVKKIRNSLYASGLQPHHTKEIITPLGPIHWKHFTEAYQWDKETHYLRLHRKLTREHFVLNTNLKMRNHLAEQVLDGDMAYLLEQYQATLDNPAVMQPVIELVRMTSQFITIFRSSEAITSLEDPRLTELGVVAAYFKDWNDFCRAKKKKNKNSKDNFITRQSYDDIISCIDGFVSLCHTKLPQQPILPKIINSDVVENVFCMQRTICHGANTNPDASQYRYYNYFMFLYAHKDGSYQLKNNVCQTISNGYKEIQCF